MNATGATVRAALGSTLCEDHSLFRDRVDGALDKAGIRLATPDVKQILNAVSWRVETAPDGLLKGAKP